MGPVRGLVPYAAFAFFTVGASIVALVATTLAVPVSVAERPAATASPTSTASRAVTDLSPTGRLAYWRSEANGEYILWLANADNGRRRSVAKADQPNAVSRTKWSADGGSVAYVENGVRLVVVRVDGSQAGYTLAPSLRADGYRIVDHRFSPSGARIAATVQRVSGSQSDVYVTGPAGDWVRLTTTEDVLAADWLSEDELLVQTTGGIIGRLRVSGRDQVRPLTALPAATPIIGADGRIHFLSGRVSGFASTSETLVYASASSVWSIAASGEDLRRETVALEADSFRLDGEWPGGYLLHRGTNPAQVAIVKTPIALPTTGGLIERLAIAADRRSAVGFAGTNLVRLDISATGVPGNAVVLLGSVNQGDAWFPRSISLAQIAAAKVDVPAARYVFALGGHLWQMGADGAPALFRAGNLNAQTLRRFALGTPQWSPSGDRLLTLESLGGGASAFQLIAVVIARDGTVRRYTSPSSVGLGATWSPDGGQFAVAALPAAATDPVVLTSDLSLLLIDAASGAATRTIGGREAFWTKAGVLVLTNGTFRTGDRARDGQAIEIWDGAQSRTITTLAKIIADPRLQAPAATRGITQTSALTGAPDGAHLALHVNFLVTDPVPAFAVIRARDGTATTVIVGDTATDESWAPTGRNIGYTLSPAPRGANARQRAVVRDGETGDVLLELDGRFAGWSPDGAWVYIARNEGLFAKRLGGGDLVRFSPYGVVVSATRP